MPAGETSQLSLRMLLGMVTAMLGFCLYSNVRLWQPRLAAGKVSCPCLQGNQPGQAVMPCKKTWLAATACSLAGRLSRQLGNAQQLVHAEISSSCAPQSPHVLDHVSPAHAEISPLWGISSGNSWHPFADAA